MQVSRGSSLDEGTEEHIAIMMPLLNEYQRRIFLASLASSLGWGSASEISDYTGVSMTTLKKGKDEIESLMKDPKARPKADDTARVRAEGGGRKKAEEKDPNVRRDLIELLDGNIIGDPESPLTWTTLSTRTLSEKLKAEGHDVSHAKVSRMLSEEGFSLQQNKKYVQTGDPGPDRDRQFRYIKEQTEAMIGKQCPVISVDAKKKELVGDYANKGREYRRIGHPRLVNDHDFQGPGGKAVPYGIYDIDADEGFVSVGISHDTARFAVNSIRGWWHEMGKERYPDADHLMITADSGGSNGRRNRLWKAELQRFANETGMTILVRHFPPGTSKWNKIEHRLFSFISMNWAGKPLTSLGLIVNLIGSTRTRSGLMVRCKIDDGNYAKGIRITDDEMKELNLIEEEWRGDWNYRIVPNK